MKKFGTLFIIIVFAAAVGILWWKNGIQAVHPEDKKERIFVIHKGEGMREISQSLKKEGFIKDPVVFFLLVKKLGLDGKIQAGDFRISPSMSAFDIAQTLTHGTLDVWITIPEGKRAEEIVEIIKKKLPDFQSKLMNDYEGYLFPDTYLIPKNADEQLIISIMKSNFEKKYDEIQNIKNTNVTKKDILIIASLVEREARFPQDRPLVASVILNRLKLGMTLQIDATVQYALGYQQDQKTWWKKNVTKQDLETDSLYNTYKYPGLPQAPIANPGSDALNAVVNAPDTNYFYYVSDKSGHNHYAKTIEEHNANIRKFGL